MAPVLGAIQCAESENHRVIVRTPRLLSVFPTSEVSKPVIAESLSETLPELRKVLRIQRSLAVLKIRDVLRRIGEGDKQGMRPTHGLNEDPSGPGSLGIYATTQAHTAGYSALVCDGQGTGASHPWRVSVKTVGIKCPLSGPVTYVTLRALEEGPPGAPPPPRRPAASFPQSPPWPLSARRLRPASRSAGNRQNRSEDSPDPSPPSGAA